LPLLAAFTVDMPNPGDIKLFDHAGPPIILARNLDGEVNAFFNMCTHRAARLVTESQQDKRKMSCPFHGWTFSLSGELKGVPCREGFAEDDLAGRDLIKVPVGEWGGMIFVKACAGEETIDVEAYLGDLAPVMLSMELDKADLGASDRIDVTGNWKAALDTFTEGYHVGFLHPESVGAMFIGGTNVFNHYGRHHNFNFAAQFFPEMIKQIDPASNELEGSVAGIYFIFPNTVINFFPTSSTERLINMHRIFPGDHPGHSFSVQDTYNYGGKMTEEQRETVVANHNLVVHVVSNEDFRVVGNSHSSLEYAPPGFRTLVGRNEEIVQRVSRDIAEIVGLPL